MARSISIDIGDRRADGGVGNAAGARTAACADRARPLIGYAIGTHGIGDAAAPSRLLARGLEWEAGLIAMVLARGWAVAITDYQGLGTPGDHTYMVGRALGPNVLDAMRAARELHPEELPSRRSGGDHRLLRGRRGGGLGRTAAAELRARTFRSRRSRRAPRRPNVESCRSDASTEASSRSSSPTAGSATAAAYPELDLDPYLTLDGAEGDRRRCASRRCLQAMLCGPRFIRASDLTQPNVLELPEWRRRLRENRLGQIAPAAPVLLHHARRDQIVSFEQSVKLRDALASGSVPTCACT